jgi:hypothetical protein
MSERSDEQVRDFEAAGDVGEQSHSAFAKQRDGEPSGNDERLGMRGRSTGADETGLLDEVDAGRRAGRTSEERANDRAE